MRQGVIAQKQNRCVGDAERDPTDESPISRFICVPEVWYRVEHELMNLDIGYHFWLFSTGKSGNWELSYLYGRKEASRHTFFFSNPAENVMVGLSWHMIRTCLARGYTFEEVFNFLEPSHRDSISSLSIKVQK